MTNARILAALTAALLTTVGTASAAPVFNRIANFPVALNAPDAKTTSSEIIAASDDGMTLVYSDSPAGGIGFVDITDPKAPKPAGFIGLDGEPTSVTIIGGKVYAAVNTSESKANPSGKLVVVDMASKAIETSVDLGGQPDSVAHNAKNNLLAVAIENERDEELNDGDLPQMPAGYLVLLSLKDGVLDTASLKKVDVTGLAEVAPEDPEPEFVAFNDLDEVALTLQENNHIVIIDGRTGEVKTHFSAGTVTVEGIDTKKDGALKFTGKLDDVAREPDSVKWLDDNRLVIANEGDWKGGSRGFTILNKDGSVAYDAGASLDLGAAQFGHYPDARNKKGVEPEGLDVAMFGEDKLFFVAEERSSLIAVYKDAGEGKDPEYLQALPSGISPEGLVAIPSRNLLATANEFDGRADGVAGSHVMIYERAEGEANYPQIVSDLDGDGHPIGFAALSGAVADAEKPGMLYVVSDSVLSAQPSIYTIDATTKPARITSKLVVTRGGDAAQKLDLEGITLDGEGGFWLPSEGRSDRLVPHALYHVDADGKIVEEVAFPEALLPSEIRFGAEGITRIGDVLWVAIQREWKDDPAGQVKLLGYDTKEKKWSAVRYPLDAAADGAWNGLSEITAHGDYVYVIERDNQVAEKAAHKKIYRVPVANLTGVEIGGELPVVTKELAYDLLPELAQANGYVAEKVESLAIDTNGTGYVITDNDGLADNSGETFFFTVQLDK
jgi:sugar lactone lactonase YvrE